MNPEIQKLALKKRVGIFLSDIVLGNLEPALVQLTVPTGKPEISWHTTRLRHSPGALLSIHYVHQFV